MSASGPGPSPVGLGTGPRNPLVRNEPLALPGFTQADQDAEMQRDRDAERRLIPITLVVLAVIGLVGLLNLLTQ